MTTGFASTNFPNGVTNATLGTPLGTFIAADPSLVHSFFDDFNSFTAAQWTVTETQGSATQAITNGDGGILALVNSSANNDLNAIQLANETFSFVAGKQAWFKARFSLSNATNAAMVLGLQITDTTPLAASDGVWFSKAAASTTLNMVVEASSALTTTQVATGLANATYYEVGFHYNGGSGLYAFYNGNYVASSAITNLPTRTLTISAAVSNGTAAANTMNIDYIFAATER
jgi:hypothetical protein